MRFTKMNKDSKGFTLIELLIVIIIIGILAAIAFVAYSGSQNKAHKADAQSTLSQVRTKLGEYNANNGNYPTNKAALQTWVESADGGKNQSLSDKLDDAGYTYSGTPAGCDNTSVTCDGYTATAKGTLFGGQDNTTDNITVHN